LGDQWLLLGCLSARRRARPRRPGAAAALVCSATPCPGCRALLPVAAERAMSLHGRSESHRGSTARDRNAPTAVGESGKPGVEESEKFRRNNVSDNNVAPPHHLGVRNGWSSVLCLLPCVRHCTHRQPNIKSENTCLGQKPVGWSGLRSPPLRRRAAARPKTR
jgi:hypothetical protein